MSDLKGRWIDVGKMPLGTTSNIQVPEPQPVSYTEAKVERLEEANQKLAQGLDLMMYMWIGMFGMMCVLWLWNRISISSMKSKFNRIQEIRSWTR